MYFSDLELDEVVAIKDMPDGISDGSMFDLHIQDYDKPLLKHPNTRKAATASNVISQFENCTNPLPTGILKLLRFRLVNEKILNRRVIDYGDFYIQTQYLEYFSSRYNNCEYFYKREPWMVIVKQNNEIVGAIMPIPTLSGAEEATAIKGESQLQGLPKGDTIQPKDKES